jgi:hypothetical protein
VKIILDGFELKTKTPPMFGGVSVDELDKNIFFIV